MRIDLVGTRKWFFLGSAIGVLVSLVLLAIPPALVPGIEFTSGTTTQIVFDRPVTQEDLRAAYEDLGHPDARIQSTGENSFLIRTGPLEVPDTAFVDFGGTDPSATGGTLLLGEEGAEGDVDLVTAPITQDACTLGGTVIASAPAGTEVTVLQEVEDCGDFGTILRVQTGDGEIGWIAQSSTHEPPTETTPEAEAAAQARNERAEIEAELEERFGPFQVLEFSQVSPVVSEVAVRNAAIAVAVATVFIMAYIAFAFSSTARPVVYAVCAAVALVHDVIIVLGAFSLFGKLFGTEINLMFVTGLLTVVGFSVHDTIVVFDRIRENVLRHPFESLAENVNTALLQTMARSLNTSITLLLTVLALLFLGGVTIREFLLVILVGVIAGMYSSIGVAAQLMVAYEEGEIGRAWNRLRGRREPAAAS